MNCGEARWNATEELGARTGVRRELLPRGCAAGRARIAVLEYKTWVLELMPVQIAGSKWEIEKIITYYSLGGRFLGGRG